VTNTFTLSQKISISNFYFLFIYKILEKKYSTTVFNIDNNKKCFTKSLYYKGSCDTEDWSNDAESSALHHWNKLHFKMLKWKTVILN